MCDAKLKKEIYNEFDKGLEPEDVAKKLNINNDRRVVYGCWFWYQKRKNENTQKTLIDEEMENSNNLVNRQNECIKNIAKYGRELLNILKEMNELEVNKRVEDYSFARQVLLHSIENGKEPSNVLSKLQNISKVRRNYKIMDSRLDKITKIKKSLNDSVVAMEYILPSMENNSENGTELFIHNRIQNADEHRLELLSAIRE